ncbi:MAG: hypothetical protein KatS3mg108_1344 [Isosphaeraceae bacterium]|jgi:hypothetical protein|nr:MAG: hypothetical protein KatS3mg108_1344 [Isosphaeraceae bacterium]
MRCLVLLVGAWLNPALAASELPRRPLPVEGFSAFGPDLADCLQLLQANLESPPSQPPSPQKSRSVRVADPAGGTRVAREYGPDGSRMLILPDGQIVWTDRPVYVNDAFLPDSPEALRDRLLAGPYAGFKSLLTPRYVLLYTCSDRFAESSGRLLESLCDGLLKRFRERGFSVHEPEFPLVGVIFATEAEFRAHREVAPDVQAYFDVISNRIFLYETRSNDLDDPKLAVLRKPQTIAHEGTHQILQNIGVQQRLADWPAWVVEGLAELAASTQSTRDTWAGMSQVNPFHVATLEDLLDASWLQQIGVTAVPAPQEWRQSLVEYLSRRRRLTPTDYALAWTLTHYLANRRTDAFLAYLKTLAAREPGVAHSDDEDLAVFRDHFGPRLDRLDRQVTQHVQRLRAQVPLAYYAVTFEQVLSAGRFRRATLVTRSPAIVREWVEERLPDPRGGPYQWEAVPFRDRAVAYQYTQQWLQSR